MLGALSLTPRLKICSRLLRLNLIEKILDCEISFPIFCIIAKSFSLLKNGPNKPPLLSKVDCSIIPNLLS